MKTKRILVCEDEEAIRDFVVIHLKRSGYDVFDVPSGEMAVKAWEQGMRFDVAILDIMMPGMDGTQVCRFLRERSNTIGIIMLSAKSQEMDKVNCLMMGADDYVTKPFSPKELMLRVDAIMKRVNRPVTAEGQATKPNVVISLDNGGLRADVTARLVFIDDNRVEMSPKEYDLFFYLLNNRNIALSREKLLCEVWGYDFYGDARTLDTHIKLLRKSLGRYSRYIVTLRGVGYRFEGV